MGKHYLRRSRRHTERFRHLKRTWPAVGQSKSDAPNIGTLTQDDETTVLLDVIYPAPNFAVKYTIKGTTGVFTPGDPEGEPPTEDSWAFTAFTATATAVANATVATIATAIATALNGIVGTQLAATAVGATVSIAAGAGKDSVGGITVIGEATAAPTFLLSEGVPQDEPEPEAAPPVVTPLAKTGKKGR